MGYGIGARGGMSALLYSDSVSIASPALPYPAPLSSTQRGQGIVSDITMKALGSLRPIPYPVAKGAGGERGRGAGGERGRENNGRVSRGSRVVAPPPLDKILCSSWLEGHHTVVTGTKCGRIALFPTPSATGAKSVRWSLRGDRQSMYGDLGPRGSVYGSALRRRERDAQQGPLIIRPPGPGGDVARVTSTRPSTHSTHGTNVDTTATAPDNEWLVPRAPVRVCTASHGGGRVLVSSTVPSRLAMLRVGESTLHSQAVLSPTYTEATAALVAKGMGVISGYIGQAYSMVDRDVQASIRDSLSKALGGAGHTSPVRDAVYLADNRVCTLSEEGVARVYEVPGERGESVDRPPRERDSAYLPDVGYDGVEGTDLEWEGGRERGHVRQHSTLSTHSAISMCAVDPLDTLDIGTSLSVGEDTLTGTDAYIPTPKGSPVRGMSLQAPTPHYMTHRGSGGERVPSESTGERALSTGWEEGGILTMRERERGIEEGGISSMRGSDADAPLSSPSTLSVSDATPYASEYLPDVSDSDGDRDRDSDDDGSHATLGGCVTPPSGTEGDSRSPVVSSPSLTSFSGGISAGVHAASGIVVDGLDTLTVPGGSGSMLFPYTEGVERERERLASPVPFDSSDLSTDTYSTMEPVSSSSTEGERENGRGTPPMYPDTFTHGGLESDHMDTMERERERPIPHTALSFHSRDQSFSLSMPHPFDFDTHHELLVSAVSRALGQEYEGRREAGAGGYPYPHGREGEGEREREDPSSVALTHGVLAIPRQRGIRERVGDALPSMPTVLVPAYTRIASLPHYLSLRVPDLASRARDTMGDLIGRIQAKVTSTELDADTADQRDSLLAALTLLSHSLKEKERAEREREKELEKEQKRQRKREKKRRKREREKEREREREDAESGADSELAPSPFPPLPSASTATEACPSVSVLLAHASASVPSTPVRTRREREAAQQMIERERKREREVREREREGEMFQPIQHLEDRGRERGREKERAQVVPRVYPYSRPTPSLPLVTVHRRYMSSEDLVHLGMERERERERQRRAADMQYLYASESGYTTCPGGAERGRERGQGDTLASLKLARLVSVYDCVGGGITHSGERERGRALLGREAGRSLVVACGGVTGGALRCVDAVTGAVTRHITLSDDPSLTHTSSVHALCSLSHMAQGGGGSVFLAGCGDGVLGVDTRMSDPLVHHLVTPDRGWGCRSVVQVPQSPSFICGGGGGCIMPVDTRTWSPVPISVCQSQAPSQVVEGPGLRDPTHEVLPHYRCQADTSTLHTDPGLALRQADLASLPLSVFTLSVPVSRTSTSGRSLFVGGGPLQAGVHGYHASVYV
ncbi:hypothetical protein KIPB_003048 [Kipferlia bialata]|uniref:Uncharacterized protein n=1 Tax=Kipferlia bialata TaxID=797122 RepID=A0A9K3GFI5_9EUKA|nr:hypothetical protein KIPB_003048 [Kipferlia bialata]|eukprot:g3048.t1